MSNPLFKVDPKYLHPFESYVYTTLNNHIHHLRPYNITPNHLTTCNIITSIISGYYLYKNTKSVAIIFLILSYIFDCSDGLYARKYKMVSKFGDYYDHISDLIQYLLYTYILFTKYQFINYRALIIIIIVQLVLMFAYMNEEALKLTISSGYAHYWSRSRESIWKKGETSGMVQKLNRMLIDDDQDSVVIEVILAGPDIGGKEASCHVGYRSCFYREVSIGESNINKPLKFIEDKKSFDPEKVYKDMPNPTKL